MNSLYKVCKSIDSKLDKINIRLDTLETKISNIESYYSLNVNKQLTDEDKNEEKDKKDKKKSSSSKIKIRTKSKSKSITSPSIYTTSVVEKIGSIQMDKYADKTLITGDTFQKKMFIKKYKGIWSPDHKGWIVVNTQDVNELKKQLKQLSLTFNYIKHNHNINGSKNTNEEEFLNIHSQYAFISDE